MPLPNFLFIGTGKAGSTSLYYYLKQHPDIYMSPIKETNFFSYEGGRPDFCGPGDRQSTAHKETITTIEDYRENFRGVTNERMIGEVSPSYIYVPEAPQRIKHYVPDAKLLVILRDPAERAYSNFSGLIKAGREPLTDFAQAIREEEARIQQNWAPTWHNVNHGFYSVQLQRYFDLFDRQQLKIYLFEDWIRNTATVLKDIFQFLEVDDTIAPDTSKKYNVSGKPKNQFLHNFLTKSSPIKSVLKPLLPKQMRQQVTSSLQENNLTKLPPLSPELRQQLVQLYRDDILKLQDLIGRDLSKWLQ